MASSLVLAGGRSWRSRLHVGVSVLSLLLSAHGDVHVCALAKQPSDPVVSLGSKW